MGQRATKALSRHDAGHNGRVTFYKETTSANSICCENSIINRLKYQINKKENTE